MLEPLRMASGIACIAVGLAGCSSDSDSEPAASGAIRELKSSAPRAAAVEGAEQAAVADLSKFGWSFYAGLDKPSGNFVYSPLSIAVASAMLSAGAASDTLTQLKGALQFSDTGVPLHTAQNALQRVLESRNRQGNESQNAQYLRISNDFWMLPELTPTQPFLDTLAEYYGAGIHLAPFDTDPELCRREINAKVSDDTSQLIPELLPAGSIDQSVVFVLTNALYFKANWHNQFDAKLTRPGPFTTLAGETLETQMMHQELGADYLDGDGFIALSLPYAGSELSMLFLVPELGSFDAFASSLDAAKVDDIVLALERTQVELTLPKFEVSGDIPLAKELEAAGMVDAFDPRLADFTPIGPDIYISDAFHKARLTLDEEGTEAAAATAFVGVTVSIPPEPVPVVIDRPFLFMVRDKTGAPLFIGQLGSPE